jgi:chemosensory pili system protein ChpA (sensor histidine kinase/response regulator)
MSQEMQQHLLATRLVAISTLSPRLQRIARQTSESLGKQVKLEIQGEQCELDRVVLQKITAPLEHMIRNAVSHGIESPQQRLEHDKKACGRVVLKIQRDGAEIVLRLSDDGQGINCKAVYEKALAMEIINADDKLSDEAIQRLIFHSGLSTSSELSQISGRGVGMDIVKREIKSMGGNLQLLSNNKGTEFVIHLPLTLATNHVLLFEVAKQRYAIPMTGVVGLQRISYRELQKNFAKKKPKQLYNKYQYKLQHLAQVLQQPIIFEGHPEDKCPVLFVHMDGQRIAYRLDKISGNRDVVIKPLGRILHASSLYTAATIELDGYVIPILNTLELVHRKPKKIQLTQAYQQQLKAVQTHKATIMIVDDSITIRKITKALLRSHGYEVITAKDGMHALEVLSSQQPDVMLLDIEMPRMDGFELLSNLRNTDTWRDLPVIMISSRTAEKHRRYAEAVGVHKFMGKPYQEAELLDSIQQLLEQKLIEQAPSPISPEIS